MSRALRRRNKRISEQVARSGGRDPLEQDVQKALSLQRTGHAAQAAGILQDVLRTRPDHPSALHFLGLLHFGAGRTGEGMKLMARSVELVPGNADFHNNYATVLRQANRLTASIAHCHKALELRPDFAFAHSNLAIALKQAGCLDEAVRAAGRALELQPNHADLQINLANTLREAGHTDEAIRHYGKALAARPNDGDLLYQIGWTHIEKGAIADAASAFRRVIELQPRRADAHHALATIKRPESYDAEMEAMKRLFEQSGISDSERTILAFALAKSLEDIGRIDEAFACLETGNALVRSGYSYSSEASAAQFEHLKSLFTPDLFARRGADGHDDPTPVFVLGMPRSGTTLFEQILASHRDVAALGEVTTLQRIAERSLDPDGKQRAPDSIPADLYRATGREYVETLRQRSGSAKRITDKMPGNFVLIGLIRLILPKATILHCVRDPASTCLSIFKTYFRSRGHHYAYDLAELGDYYRLYADLMAHWHATLPGFVHDFHYETLVANQERESRRMVEICGLDWDPACMNFQNAERPVRTASAAQVRRPIYDRSVDLWRSYEPHLGPLLKRLPT